MGSNPVTRFDSPVAQLGERLSYKEDVAGSIPAGTINLGECSSTDRAPRFGRGCCGFNSYHSRCFSLKLRRLIPLNG